MTAADIVTLISIVGLVLAGILLPLTSVARERTVGPEGRIGRGGAVRGLNVAVLTAALLAVVATVARMLMLAA